MLVLMVVMIGFMFFSQSKKAKQHAAMLKTLKSGDRVVLPEPPAQGVRPSIGGAAGQPVRP